MLVSNMGLVFGVLSDTVEVALAVVMMLGGIYITYLIQKWADRSGEQPAAANVGFGGHPDQREATTMRE
jgi:threonine/homoserine/homoserine lactone efflux protein